MQEDDLKDKQAKDNIVLSAVSRSFSSEELYGLWQFANAQFQMIKSQKEKSSNNVEIRCLSFTANCIVDIMDEIAEMLEPSENCG